MEGGNAKIVLEAVCMESGSTESVLEAVRVKSGSAGGRLCGSQEH